MRATARAVVVAALVAAVALAGPPLAGALPAAAAPFAVSDGPEQGCGAAWERYGRPATHRRVRQVATEAAIPMSDGVVLRAAVWVPAGGPPGPFPTVLTITGYNKSGPLGAASDALGTRGYAQVIVDDRGTGTSGGQWEGFGARSQRDYGEVLDWIVDQPWSDGRIGMVGGSYMAITQLLAAAQQRPALKALFTTVPMADAYRDIVFAGGQANLGFIPLWMGLVTALGSLPPGYLLQDPSAAVRTLVDHVLGITQFQLPTVADAFLGSDLAYDGPFWRERSPIEAIDRVDVPTFVIGGLDDIFQRGEPMLYEALTARGVDSRLVIGPWTHLTAGAGTAVGGNGLPPLSELQLQWLDQHVMGLDAGAECMPRVTQWMTGRERYEIQPDWPHPRLEPRRLHLRAGGALTDGAPERAEPGRRMLAHPLSGICSRSTNQWLIGLITATPCATDNRLAELDQLVYETPPLDEPLVLNGPIQADLWVSTTARDAVVSVAVSDVAPDGTSRGLSNGLLQASLRAVDPDRSRVVDGASIQPWHPFTAASVRPVPQSRPMELQIEVFPTSAVIRPGHRLRVAVAPSDFPHAVTPLPGALASLLGVTTVHHGPATPSRITLPVVPAQVTGAPEVAPNPAVEHEPAPPAASPAAGRDTLPATGGAGPSALVGLALAGALAAVAGLRRHGG